MHGAGVLAVVLPDFIAELGEVGKGLVVPLIYNAPDVTRTFVTLSNKSGFKVLSCSIRTEGLLAKVVQPAGSPLGRH